MATKQNLQEEIYSMEKVIYDLTVQIDEAKGAFEILKKHTADVEISKQRIQNELYSLEEELDKIMNKQLELMRLVRHYETTINILTGRLIEGSHTL